MIFNSQRALENVAEEEVLDQQAQAQKPVSAKVCSYFSPSNYSNANLN